MAKISLQDACSLFARAQGLDGSWSLPDGAEGAAQVVERLGLVQIDTISVVERAHHHIFWSRFPQYQPEMLHQIHARDQRVFEGWGYKGPHRVAAYLPMAHYRYYLPAMKAFADAEGYRSWREENAALVRGVRERIEAEGPLGSADFTDPSGKKRGPWWDWKPAKRALESLFAAGELMVAERRSFQRRYDLTERVLPPGTDVSFPSPEEQARFLARKAVAAYGLASVNEIRGRQPRPPILDALETLGASGEVTPVEVEGASENPYYTDPNALECLSERIPASSPLHLLSPFDPFAHNSRSKAWFGFEHRFECFVPEPQRQYGYFSLPIFQRDRFLGRLDPKADRKEKTLLVRNLVLEPDIENEEDVLPTLAESLWDYARFNGCERILVERGEPDSFVRSLRQTLTDP